MSTYSFISIQGSLVGPGGNITLGNSSGSSEEGITIAFKEEKNTMTIGADGTVMHSLHAGTPGRMTVRLLKTSPINKQLSSLFNYQRLSPANWGTNVISFTDVDRGDTNTLSDGAFVKPPDIVYDKEGRFNEWIFDGSLTQSLGAG